MSTLLDARFAELYSELAAGRLAPWLETLPAQVQAALYEAPHGKRDLWLQTLEQLPDLSASSCDFEQGAVRIGQASNASSEQQAA
ncbi:MAG TPA: DUF1698 domain-containing protein, partial [Thiolinea sp.]|nr:DUF1698 domain-containing protein [Thiolinea sp.]